MGPLYQKKIEFCPILRPLKVVMKILDESGNQITGTPDLAATRGKDYSIQIDFTDPIVDSYEEQMNQNYLLSAI